ncbi:hypothetical protein MKZ38_002776 [Zalerion maritima]|uniref:Clr5 domain-containing protein n=1 Tax=Zalerion maritima TaxID=339359 RepID=A0AAD5RNG4_9PEZI|nr:hypothetical protein MKZ38_002776 [Zalerion maritima]
MGAHSMAHKLASASDWARNRELITQLYQEKELGQVRDIMKTEFGFHSTPKIYKNHIREWNIGKRLCDADVLAILDMRARPGASGKKQTEFWIRGHRVSEKNITRYLRRKPKLLARFLEGDRPPEGAKNQVVCKPKMPPLSHSVPPVPTAPVTILELFFLDCRDYVRGSFDNGHWRADMAGECFSLVDGDRASKACDDADLHFTLASQEMDDKNFASAYQLLGSCWSRLSDTLALEDPYFLETFISMVVKLRQRDQLEPLGTLATTMMDGAMISHGDAHKLTNIIFRLHTLSTLETADAIARVFEVLEDEADRALGLGSKFASTMLLTHAQLLSSGAMGAEEAAARIRKQLDMAEKLHGEDDWVADLELHHSWASCLSMYEQGRLDDAEEALRAVKPRIRNDHHRASHHSVAGDFYSWQNNWDAARAEYEEAYFAAERQGNIGVVQRCLKDLIHVSERNGNLAGAGMYRLLASRQQLAGKAAETDWSMGTVLGEMG